MDSIPTTASRRLPSIFAIPAIRERLIGVCELTMSREELVALLQLDPPTVLRCLRIAGTPFVGLRDDVRSIGDLVDQLGRSFVLRSLRVPASCHRHVTTQTLWLHAIATATIARDLAREPGSPIDPEQAYLVGLLRQMTTWITLIDDHWDEHVDWRANLPRFLVEPLSDAAERLLRSAEIIASIAEFPAPDDDASVDPDDVLDSYTRETLVKAHALRRSLQRELSNFGLPSAPMVDFNEASRNPTEPAVFRVEQRGSGVDFIAGLLLCRQSSSYRAIITVLTSAALRYLDFDKATFIAWQPATHSVFVKSKADFTIRKLENTRCLLEDDEATLLRECLSDERPKVLSRSSTDSGLMHYIGADEALVMPVSREFDTPTFLVLDRTLSQRPIRLDEDATPAAVLCSTVGVLTDNLLLRLQRIRAQRSAVTDPLTRLNNRVVGLMALEREMLRARREDLELSVLMIDLDDFKSLNDTYGHLVGDQSLRMTANILRRTMRRSDVSCRYGGEEFLIVLPATSAEDASVLAARLFVEVENAGQEQRLPLTVSIGLACLRDGDDRPEDLIHRADRALYASKSRGRNRFSVDIHP